MDITNLAKQYLQNNKNVTQEQIETAYKNIGDDFSKAGYTHESVLWDPFSDEDKAIDENEFVNMMNKSLSGINGKASTEEDYKLFFDMFNTSQDDDKISLQEYKTLIQSNLDKDGQAITGYSLWTTFVHGSTEDSALSSALSEVTLSRVDEDEELENVITSATGNTSSTSNTSTTNVTVQSALNEINAGNAEVDDYKNTLSYADFNELLSIVNGSDNEEKTTDINAIYDEIQSGVHTLAYYANSVSDEDYQKLVEKLNSKNETSNYVSAFKDALKNDKSEVKSLLKNLEGKDSELVDIIYEFNQNFENQTEDGTNSFIMQLDQNFINVNSQQKQVANALVNEAKNGNTKALELLCNEMHNGTAGIKNGTADAFIAQIFDSADSSLLKEIADNYSKYNDGADIRTDIRNDFIKGWFWGKEKEYINKINSALIEE